MQKKSTKKQPNYSENPVKIGIVRGEEDLFPERLITVINEQVRSEQRDIYADYVMIGGTDTDQCYDYAVILDRISHKLPFLRTILKNAALNGTHIINNPFNDGFYNPFFCLSLAKNLGLNIPKTMVLPSRMHPEGTSSKTMRNIIFPLDWKSYFKAIGFPCWLKPALNKKYSDNEYLENATAFFETYDKSGNVAFMMQQDLDTELFFQAYYVSGSDVLIVPKMPGIQEKLKTKHKEAISNATKKLCQALGFEINKVDFAIHKDNLYVMDALNPVPVIETSNMNDEQFEAYVASVASLLLKRIDSQENAQTFGKVVQNPNDLISVS